MPSKFSSIAIILLLSAVLFLPGLGSRTFSTKGEAREAVVVQSMWQSGNYILPLRNAEEIPSKPPMFHWLAVMTSKATGVLSEISVRLPSVLCAMLATLLTFVFFSSSRLIAFSSVVILLCSFEWARNAGHARVDMCFALWVLMMLVAFFQLIKPPVVDDEDTKFQKKYSLQRCGWVLVLGVSGAFAILTKGPAGVLFPWVITAVFVLIENKFSIKKSLSAIPVLGCVIALISSAALAGLWYWLAFQQQGDAFLQVALIRENAARLLSMEGQQVGHEKPFYFSAIYLFVGFLPWSLFLPFVFALLWKERKSLLQVENRKALFALVWVLVFLVVVTFSVSKRSVYLLPAFPALAYLTAYALQYFLRQSNTLPRFEKSTRIIFAINWIVFLLTALGVLLLSFVDLPFSLPAKSQILIQQLRALTSESPLLLVAALLIAVSFYFAARGIAYRSRKPIFAGVFTAMLLMIVAGNVFVLPFFSRQAPESIVLSKLDELSLASGKDLVQYKATYYPIVYYLGGNIRRIHSTHDLQQSSAKYVITSKAQSAEVFAALPEAKVILETKSPLFRERDQLFLLSRN